MRWPSILSKLGMLKDSDLLFWEQFINEYIQKKQIPFLVWDDDVKLEYCGKIQTQD